MGPHAGSYIAKTVILCNSDVDLKRKKEKEKTLYGYAISYLVCWYSIASTIYRAHSPLYRIRYTLNAI
jgi:hypothetical protein